MDETQEQAIPFLIYDQHSKVFTLTEQGEEVIRSLNSNFGVISVAGMYRTGKSYLLNRMLLNREKGFSVGPTVNPCTKGLWIWSKPIYGIGEDGKRVPILLIDTEGFGAFDEDTNHDIRIFTLAILLCSFFVYNSLGSIDENAIQSLSFVINLSKHIQLKSSGNLGGAYTRMNSDADFDHEELANLFPSFLWVLRDFALQLVDENGETITAKEYLEKVLDNTKSHQEQEQKNKIRKLIKTYFKDRDCYAMVRPMLKEKDLQNLDNSGADKLRPEFLEQVLQLRKKILSRVKVKTFKNKPLTPDMYINLIKSLIDAINSGKVPNIESTWISMCKLESYKAFELAQSIYEDFIRDTFNTNGISDQETFKKFHSEAKEKSLTLFKSKALGEVSEDYLKLLREKIKEKFNYYSKYNIDESKNNLMRILQKWYSVIEYKIQAGELKNVDEIETEFKNLEVKFHENFGKFDFRFELFNDFKSKVLNFAGDFFTTKMKSEVELLKQENKQIINKLNQDIIELKSNHEKEILKKAHNIEILKTENNEIKESFNKLKENFALLEKEKILTEKSLGDKMERIKEDHERKITDINLKSNHQEDKVKEFERKAITIQAESEKEKALYEQKIEQLTKQIEDFTKKERESGVELKSQLKEQAIALRESIQKHESSAKSFQLEIESLKDKIIDLESHINEKDQRLEMEKNKNEELEKKMSSERNELIDRINTLKKNFDSERNKYVADIKNKEGEYSSKENLMKIKLEELELKNKTIEETLKNQIAKLERESAIMKQNNEFFEIQTKELNNQMEEQRKNHENVISALESKTFSMVGHEEFQKKVEEIKEYFEKDKKQNEENYEKSKNLLMLQIDSLTEKLNESEFRGKFNMDEMSKEISELKIRLEKSNKELVNLRAEKSNLNEVISQVNEEAQQRIKNIVDEYERKIEEKEYRHQMEMTELNKTSEESVNQLKILFESEKIRFDEKTKDEKMKSERKIKNLIEDHETKIREVENDLNEQIENLQNEKDNLEEMHRNYMSNRENEIENLIVKIDALEVSLRESNDAYNNIKNNLNTQIDNLNDQFNKERNDLQAKIENLTNDSNKKEKEITSLQIKKDQYEKMVHDKELIYSNLKREFEEEKNEILLKLESYKQKYQQSNDEYMVNKLEYTRLNALLNQQLEYLNKKLDEKEKENEENHKRYDERLFSLRSEVEKDMNEKFERLQKEKEDTETKLLQKKKEIKDIEQTFIKQNNFIEKEKAILNEKLISLEDKKKEMQEHYEREIQNLSSNLNISQKDILKERQDLTLTIETLKKNLNKLEVDLMEKNTELEKNQILFDGKYKFLEQQRDNLKKDYTESQKRFETMLETIQKKASSDKEKMETSNRDNITSLEQKNSTQIKEMQETHQRLYSELLQSNKDLDRQVKSLNMQAEIKNKSYDNTNLLFQIEEINNDRNRLRKELETLRVEKDKRINEVMNSTERDKEFYRIKTHEIDEKMKEIETKKKSISLEFEIERAKWSIEKDNFISKNSEQSEIIERMEKKYETLLRENEKLKSDKSNHKRSNSKAGLNIGGNPPMIKDLNSSMPNNNYFSTTNKDYVNRYDNSTKNYNFISSNPYNTNRDSNKIIDSSLINEGSMNSSRNFNEKSFDKYDTKLDNRYDKIDNNFTKYSSNLFGKPPISGQKSIIFKSSKEENGISENVTNLSFNKDIKK